MAQICKKCLLREMAEADAKMIEKYKEAIKKEDQVSESEYERRLTVCSISSASSPRHSPTTILSGRIRSAVRIRSRIVIGFTPSNI